MKQIPSSLFSRKSILIFQHVAIWVLILWIPSLMQFGVDNQYSSFKQMHFFNAWDLANKLLWVPVFYLNAYVFVPFFWNRKKYVLYGLFVLFGLLLVLLLHYCTRQLFEPPFLLGKVPQFTDAEFRSDSILRLPNNGFGRPPMPQHFKRPPFFIAPFHITAYFLTILASLVYRFVIDKEKSEIVNQQVFQENMKTELSFLRSQISPHFLFNVLNNITALARVKSDDLEPTVYKLSSLLRYMLYDSNEELVPLNLEVAYLKNYIDLQMQRFGKHVKLNLKLGETENDFRIAPMLLIPFVENAFKHGVGDLNKPEIVIELKLYNDVAYFYVSNRFNPSSGEIKDASSGIGLVNVERRLSLLYPNRHRLLKEEWISDETEKWFVVHLEINLKDD